MTHTERACAKINLHLDITGRLKGGYHSVRTVMQTVSLWDDVTLRLREGEGFRVACNVAGVPTDERNIAVRAANLFCERTGIRVGGVIEIEKRIPMAAGMAGGSADGAATLRGLNRLFEEPLTTEELCALGSVLGADVPFCVVGGTTYADGRGDVLHPFPPMPDCVIVAVCEGEGVSTPWGYGLLDRLYGDFREGGDYRPRSVTPLEQALRAGSVEAAAKAMYNIFEEPVLAERPVAAHARQLLRERGALRAMMSGSGPSVFGIFPDEAAARPAADALREAGYTPYLCRPQAKKS